MAASRQRASYKSTTTYVDGSTVRKTYADPRPAKRQAEPKRSQRIDHTVRRNQEKALHMDLPYVILLTIAAVCTLYICVNYLHLQSSITGRIYRIELLEKEVEMLRYENNAMENSINTYVDLDYVFKVATEELGMVYANKDQILLYNKTESEYVRQYEDIPKH